MIRIEPPPVQIPNGRFTTQVISTVSTILGDKGNMHTRSGSLPHIYNYGMMCTAFVRMMAVQGLKKSLRDQSLFITWWGGRAEDFVVKLVSSI